MQIDLPTGFYETNDKIYKAKSVDLKAGLSVLVGCNGAGKTTFLKILGNECKKNDIPLFTYDNLFDGGTRAKSQMLLNSNIAGLARNMVSSEGENIANNIANVAQKMGAFVNQYRHKSKTIVFAFDAIDSGLSIDGVIEVKRFFKFMINHEASGGLDLYVVVSANNYEVANGEKCVDIVNGKYITFSSYDEYREFVLKSREVKDARYKKQRGAKKKRG